MNRTFYIRYNDNEVVKVATHFDNKRLRRELPLEDVADIIAAFFMNASPDELGKYTLHEIIDGVEGPALVGISLTEVKGGLKHDNPLVIKSKSDMVGATRPATTEDLGSKLVKIGVTVEKFKLEKALRYIMRNQPMTYLLLKTPTLTLKEANEILIQASSYIMSQTRKEIGLHNNVFLDGTLSFAQGQPETTFYMAFSDSLRILIAKVFNSARDSYLREVSIRRKIGKHENIIDFYHAFDINDTRQAIIMPLLPASLASCKLRWAALPFPGIAMIARDCFNALDHIHLKGICFIDLKPSNIMLHAEISEKVCLVDFGAATKVGEPVIEYSPLYCLDLEVSIASDLIDWRCLGTTLAECSGFDFSESTKALDLIESVNLSSAIPTELQKVICACLSVKPDSILIGKYVDEFVESQRGKNTAWSFVYD